MVRIYYENLIIEIDTILIAILTNSFNQPISMNLLKFGITKMYYKPQLIKKCYEYLVSSSNNTNIRWESSILTFSGK